jgi:enediyne biosynthesis protein E4
VECARPLALVALGDVDGDGWCDVYLCGLDNPNALYRNLGGWKFEDITQAAGVACADQASTGAAFADTDGDGDLDLLVNSVGRGVRLFLNDGKGTFREGTEAAGPGGGAGGTSLALADVDGDGFLDLYAVNYRTRTLRDEPDTRFRVSTLNNEFKLLAVDGRSVTNADLAGRFTVDRMTGVLENGEPDVLYRNDRGARFVPLSWTDGTFEDESGKPIGVPYDWGLSAMFHDLNGDGQPDLYVCNDFHNEDRVWINDGSGRFRAIEPLALRHTSLFSMGVDFADIDGDGHLDIFVADMLSRSHARRQVQVADRKMLPAPPGMLSDRPQHSRNMLFWNRGDGTYAEIAQLSGLEAADWCWCPAFLDVDLDGYEDLLMVTGHERDAQNIDLSRQIENTIKQRPMSRPAQMQLRRIFPVYDTPNFAFRNRGDLTFEEVGESWGFDSTRVSQGIALADLDHDGDLDVVINCLNAPPVFHRNDTISPRLAVRLRGLSPNVYGVGAKIRVSGGAVPVQSREVTCGGRYLSGDDPVRTFAAGSETNVLRVEVTWRSGKVSVVPDVKANRIYEIDERAAAAPAPSRPRPGPAQWFEDVSSALAAHRHVEDNFDDFGLQPLLPRRFSQCGPGLAAYDYDGDGWEDLVVGAGRGGQLALFRNDTQGGFVAVKDAPFQAVATRDQSAILGWQATPANRLLLAGSANYQDGLTNGSAVRIYNPGAKKMEDTIPGQRSSTGPMVLADFEGRGQLDLFIGGQIIPGRYPEPASSLLLTNDSGTLRPDASGSKALADLGLVNGAVATDLDGDGRPELVLACEWGPIRVFRHDRSACIELTEKLGFLRYRGWWQSVQAGDFDGDGRMDLVAGNWGRNSKYQAFLKEPLRLYAGDLNGDKRVELVEAYFDPELRKIVPWRDWESLGHSMPFILERYHSFTEFSTVGVAEILGARGKDMKEFAADTLDSMLFLNRGDHFEARPLPFEAQLSPVFGLVAADLNGDGHEDLFLNQNFFAVPPETTRYDAGRGAVLQGKGDGTFGTVLSQVSGIHLYGEGRGAVAVDYDHDGRLDLVIGQNANSTKLFRNKLAQPGLRVRLVGPAGNPDGIGAVIRLRYADGRLGPAREVRAGGGYWSQDAAVQVLGTPDSVRAVSVRWPGGKVTETAVPAGAKEVELRM